MYENVLYKYLGSWDSVIIKLTRKEIKLHDYIKMYILTKHWGSFYALVQLSRLPIEFNLTTWFENFNYLLQINEQQAISYQRASWLNCRLMLPHLLKKNWCCLTPNNEDPKHLTPFTLRDITWLNNHLKCFSLCIR